MFKKPLNRSFAVFGLVVVMLALQASPVAALTIQDLQVQIQALFARINELKSQQENASPSAVQTGTTMPHRVCALMNRNLSQGMSGEDVRGIQEFLQGEGFLSVAPTGYFGPITAQAIVKWQAREGLTQAGAFGPLSRERLKAWCGGSGGWNAQERFTVYPATGEAPLEVYFETWLSGFRPNTIYYSIDFGDGTGERAADCLAPADACISAGQNRHTYMRNGTYTAILSRVTDPCAGNPACKAAIQTVPVAKQIVTVGATACTKEYKPVCGSKQVICITAPCNPIQQTYGNSCMMAADGASYVHDGECRANWDNPADDPRCKAWYDGCNSCSRESATSPAMCTLRACLVQERPYCTAYFDTVGNKPPTISGFSGPTTLAIHQTGTWSIRASDPENGQLSYSITWGDEAHVYPYGAMSAERSYAQSSSFTHAYSKAGTYTITILVQNSSGQTAQTTSTVTVTGENVVCTADYSPVCARLPGCMNTCPAGMICTMMCQLHPATTYSNRCYASAAGAEIIYDGSCTYSSGSL